MKNYKELLDQIHQNMGKFQELTPDDMKSFGGFMSVAEKPGKLDAKTKELIALGSSITSHCDWCIAYHVNGALKAGASKDEILEAGWVAVLMGGGPALMYFQGVLKALDDFGAQ